MMVAIFILFVLSITMLSGILLGFFHFKDELKSSKILSDYYSNRFKNVSIENEVLKEKLSDIKSLTIFKQKDMIFEIRKILERKPLC